MLNKNVDLSYLAYLVHSIHVWNNRLFMYVHSKDWKAK